MSSVGDVVAQLREVIERLDRTAMAAKRAQTDLTTGHSSLTDAGRGSDHPKLRLAVSESETAGAKAGKIARLLAESAGHFATYINIIAPGAAPAREQATDSTPPGEEIVRDAAERASIFRKASRATTHNAEQVGDYAKKFADFIDAARPRGATSQVQRSEPPLATSPPPSHGETAQALVVTSAVLIAGALHLMDKFRQKRKENRDRPKGTPRTHSPHGEG
ncbi:hypothetical protein ABNF97_33510 [Plantactinospora sp. B6F1]|uniref:hypothetical protein n=1 Tax=Plantactinospora sp. B6F1 TaxID=3158971 RepID=UPI0032D989E5